MSFSRLVRTAVGIILLAASLLLYTRPLVSGDFKPTTTCIYRKKYCKLRGTRHNAFVGLYLCIHVIKSPIQFVRQSLSFQRSGSAPCKMKEFWRGGPEVDLKVSQFRIWMCLRVLIRFWCVLLINNVSSGDKTIRRGYSYLTQALNVFLLTLVTFTVCSYLALFHK